MCLMSPSVIELHLKLDLGFIFCYVESFNMNVAIILYSSSKHTKELLILMFIFWIFLVIIVNIEIFVMLLFTNKRL